jgi:hypothetical protein
MHFSIRSAIVTFCPVFVAVCISPASMVAADDLFSDIAMESVFRAEKDATSSAPLTAEVVDDGQRVTGAGSLSRVLETAGLQPKKIDSTVVSVTLRQAGWTLPVLMSVAVDQDRLDIVMLLTEIGEENDWDTTRLTRLFAANAEESTLFFALSNSRKRIELRRSMSNRMITPKGLKDELLKMAMVAETYEDTWSNVVKRAESESSNEPDSSLPSQTDAVVKNIEETSSDDQTPTQPTVSSASSGLTLVGRWSASLASGEAFAIQIVKDGKFQLVVAKSGKTTISKGTASRSGNQLTLAETNGTKIVGTVQQSTADAFSLAIGGNASATLNFKRAK